MSVIKGNFLKKHESQVVTFKKYTQYNNSQF